MLCKANFIKATCSSFFDYNTSRFSFRSFEHGLSHQEMEVEESSSLDVISTLPQHIIDTILSLLPLRDALRTSILSRKWRYYWRTIPVVAFYDKVFEVSSSYNNQITKCQLANVIYQVLLQHRSDRLVELTLSVDLEMNSKIDDIILYLSTSSSNTLKHFTLGYAKFNFKYPKAYKLPSSFFSLQRLEYLELMNCEFEAPSTFNGFRQLRRLCLHNMEITAKMLKHFLTNCPLLEEFHLYGRHLDFEGGNKFTLVELLEWLPSSIGVLKIAIYFMKYFAAVRMPLKLPNPPVHLRLLIVGICFMEKDELSLVLYLINSSPNLVKLGVRSIYQPTSSMDDNFDLRGYSGLKLDHLEELELGSFGRLPVEMEFVKFIMSKSPVLKKVHIELTTNISVYEELKLRRDLPFPRTLPTAKLIIQGPQTSS